MVSPGQLACARALVTQGRGTEGCHCWTQGEGRAGGLLSPGWHLAPLVHGDCSVHRTQGHRCRHATAPSTGTHTHPWAWPFILLSSVGPWGPLPSTAKLWALLELCMRRGIAADTRLLPPCGGCEGRTGVCRFVVH